MLKLKDKWALVTGASRGVGRQIAIGLAGEGANLILHSRTIDHTKAFAESLRDQGVRVHGVAAELSDRPAVDNMLDEAFDIAGHLDILYNNAAVMTPWSKPFEAPSDDYRISFEINTIALIHICNRVIPEMIKGGFGRVVNVTSGIKDQPELMPYAVSKAAVDKYVNDIIPAVRDTGVFVNLLDPGWVRTDLGGDQAPNSVESVLPGVLIPALLKEETQGKLYCAQDYTSQT